MRKTLWATVFVVTLFMALPAFAQSPNYDMGPVWRVTYYHIKPGQGEAFWKDFRENLKPVYEAAKKEGWFVLTTHSTRVHDRGQRLRGRPVIDNCVASGAGVSPL